MCEAKPRPRNQGEYEGPIEVMGRISELWAEHFKLVPTITRQLFNSGKFPTIWQTTSKNAGGIRVGNQ